MTIRNKQTGSDVCDDVSQHVMAVQAICLAIQPKAHQLLAAPEFAAFAKAWQAACDAWSDYLEADLRATIAGGESLEALERAMKAGGRALVL